MAHERKATGLCVERDCYNFSPPAKKSRRTRCFECQRRRWDLQQLRKYPVGSIEWREHMCRWIQRTHGITTGRRMDINVILRIAAGESATSVLPIRWTRRANYSYSDYIRHLQSVANQCLRGPGGHRVNRHVMRFALEIIPPRYKRPAPQPIQRSA